MAYSTIPKGSLFMNTLLYTGNGATSNPLTGLGFQPDFNWTKYRNASAFHSLSDVVRGVNSQIYSNDTSAQAAGTNSVQSFNSDGLTVGSDSNYNGNGGTYVSWNWKAGTGQGSPNTDGSINTTYTSVNTTAKFSISLYTGTGSNATIGHGLGAVPSMVMTKRLSAGDDWIVWNKDLTNPASYLYLNGTNDEMGSVPAYQNITPTSTLLYPGTDGRTNNSGQTYITYCFADVKGYSKMASYVGNGNANGTFIYTGFKPAFFMAKRKSASGDPWVLIDNKRNTFNALSNTLTPNDTNAANTGTDRADFLSNGIKIRTTSDAWNGSGSSYIYMAFAENPFVATSGSDAIPVTAR